MGRSLDYEPLATLAGYLEEPVILWQGERLGFANQAAADLLGLPHHRLQGLSPGQLVAPAPAPSAPDRASPFLGRLLRGEGRGALVRGVCLGLGPGLQAWVFRGQASLVDLGALTAGLIHNLAGPLSVIRSTAELVEMYLREAREHSPELARQMESWPPSAQEGLATVLATVDQITAATRDLLAKMHSESGCQRQPLDLNQILRREMRFAEDDLGFKQRIQRRLELAPGLPPVWGLYSDFSQSFRNLLRNAVQAMEKSEQRVLTVRTRGGREEVVVEVEDTGLGIPPGHKDLIFEPFFTTRLNGDASSGLGLYSVKQLLRPYGVRFAVESRPGRTVFTLHIPIAPEDDGA